MDPAEFSIAPPFFPAVFPSKLLLLAMSSAAKALKIAPPLLELALFPVKVTMGFSLKVPELKIAPPLADPLSKPVNRSGGGSTKVVPAGLLMRCASASFRPSTSAKAAIARRRNRDGSAVMWGERAGSHRRTKTGAYIMAFPPLCQVTQTERSGKDAPVDRPL